MESVGIGSAERQDDLLRAAQHVHRDGWVIVRTRRYASEAFFLTPRPLVELDRHGTP